MTAPKDVTATKANEILAATELPNRIRTAGHAALEQVADFLRASGPRGTQGPSGMRDSA